MRIALAVCVALLLSMVGTGSALANPVYSTMNNSGGVYWRSAPDWNTPVAQAGNGTYPGTQIAVDCAQPGTSVPGSSDTMWVHATWVSGPGHGSGFINEHMVNDNAPLNQAPAGVPPCGGGPAPLPQPSPPVVPRPANVGCSGSSCNYRDPVAMGCSADVRSLEAFAQGGYTVALRYSSRCRATWVQITGGPNDYHCADMHAAGYLGTIEGSANKRDISIGGGACSAGDSAYSTMVDYHLWDRACLTYHPEFGNGDGYPQDVRCTGWH